MPGLTSSLRSRPRSWGRSASRHSGDSEPGPGDAEEATGDPTTPTGSKSGSGTEGDAADEQGPPPSARPSRAGSQGAARGAAGAAKTGAQTPTGTRPPLDAVLRLKQGVAVEDMAAETNEDESATRLTKRMRDRELRRVWLVVGGAVALAWLVGAAGWSLAWLLLLLAGLAAVARAPLADVLDEAVRYETRRVRARRALAQDETAEWFNFLLNRWWTFSSNSLLALLKDRLEPLLNESKPSIVESLELRQLCLGSQTPLLRGLRASELVGGRCVPLTLSSLRGMAGLGGHTDGPTLAPCHQVALQAHVELHPSDDFRCVLRTRLFGKGVGMDLDLAMEKLHLSGQVLATLTLDINAPFPHITHLSVTFVEKPDIWFSVRILKSVQAMEVPLLKTWIHSLVMDALVTSLVDPGHLDLVLVAPDCPRPAKDAGDGDGESLASGVLTLGLSVSQAVGLGAPGPDEGGARWLVVTLGSQRRTCQLSPASQLSSWSDSVSFLVGAAQLQAPTDRLQVKLKTKRLVGALTLAQYELPLSAYALEGSPSLAVDTVLHRKPTRASMQLPVINAHLEYTTLPPMTVPLQHDPLAQADQPVPSDAMQQGGVLFVVIHGAEGLSASDQNECNPYCMIFNNRQKVKTTHYMRGTTSPNWESRMQILVSDFSQASLSFVICSWSSSKMADTDLLGVAVFNFNQGERKVLRRQLALTGGSAVANITVSVAFQPVASVSSSRSANRTESGSIREKDRERPASPDSQRNIDEFSTFNKGKRNSNTWMHQAKMLLTHKDNDSSVFDISNLLSNGHGLIEVSLIKARDLVSKDLNGFSDPYCEVKVNGECKYKTCIKKKTLNPTWEESTITGMPHNNETLDIFMWDHDVFGMKDFLGSITLSCDEIRRCSALDAPQWFQLQGTKSGSVEIKIKVISDMETESISSYAPSTAPSVNSCTSSPRLPLKAESERDSNYSFKPIIRRPSMERSRLRLHADPPPPPPRTVTLQNKSNLKDASSNGFQMDLIEKSWSSSDPIHNKLNGNNGGTELRGSIVDNGNNWSPAQSTTSSPLPVPRLMVSSPRSNHNSPGRFSLRSSKPSLSPPSPNNGDSSINGDDENHFRKGNEYSSLRIMKQKVKQGLRLRRFRSEINVHEEKNGKNGRTGVALSLQPRTVDESDASDIMSGEILSHAVSQPSLIISKPKRPTDLKGLASPRPDTYVGVEGRVLQAQGLHIAHVAQLYCRVKLQTAVSPEKVSRLSGNSASGKTVAKSRLLPAVPNPRFDLHFQLDSSSPISRQAGLLFEIRSASKDIVASRRTTLQDLLSAAAPDTNEVHTWLALNNGASLEVEVAHGRELKKPARKIFRSWSVHRIGKI